LEICIEQGKRCLAEIGVNKVELAVLEMGMR
jgi:hypothetical protein